jgi:tRNA G18 (ribose-2'-O)-methylase SpoU
MESTYFNTEFYHRKVSIEKIVHQINALLTNQHNIDQFEELLTRLMLETQKIHVVNRDDLSNLKAISEMHKFKLFHVELLQSWKTMEFHYIDLIESINNYTIEKLTYFSIVNFESYIKL